MSQWFFLSSVSCSSKWMEPNHRVIGAYDLNASVRSPGNNLGLQMTSGMEGGFAGLSPLPGNLILSPGRQGQRWVDLMDTRKACWCGEAPQEHLRTRAKKFLLFLIGILSQGFPTGSEGKESAYNAGDLGLIPTSGRSPGEGSSNPFQYFCLENSMDRGARRNTVHGIAKSQTGLSN